MHPRFPPPRKQQGFSLIELVAAFVIFALGFGMLMQILTGSIRSARLSGEYTQAALWAQTKLDTVGVGEKMAEGSSSGKFDNAYHWTLEVKKYQPPQTQQSPVQTVQPVDLFRVQLIVGWGGSRNERTAQFVTLRAANPDLSNGIAAPVPGVVNSPNLGGARNGKLQ